MYFLSSFRIINLLLTEREGRSGEYWPEVVAVRTERSEVRTKTTEGQYSPVRSRASEVSKWFIIWHHFSYETTLPVVHSSQFPARCQGKKPAILTGFRISLMIVAVDRQKLALLCFYYMCQFFVVLYNTRKFYLKILLRYWQRQFGKKKNNEKAAIKPACSHTYFSNSGNCGSVLVIVNKGTLEPKKRHWKLSLHQILQVVCCSGFKENFVDAESKFSSHLT